MRSCPHYYQQTKKNDHNVCLTYYTYLFLFFFFFLVITSTLQENSFYHKSTYTKLFQALEIEKINTDMNNARPNMFFPPWLCACVHKKKKGGRGGRGRIYIVSHILIDKLFIRIRTLQEMEEGRIRKIERLLMLYVGLLKIEIKSELLRELVQYMLPSYVRCFALTCRCTCAVHVHTFSRSRSHRVTESQSMYTQYAYIDQGHPQLFFISSSYTDRMMNLNRFFFFTHSSECFFWTFVSSNSMRYMTI